MGTELTILSDDDQVMVKFDIDNIRINTDKINNLDQLDEICKDVGKYVSDTIKTSFLNHIMESKSGGTQ